MPFLCTNCNTKCVNRSEFLVHSGRCVNNNHLQCDESYSVENEDTFSDNDCSFDKGLPAPDVISVPHENLMYAPSTSGLNSTLHDTLETGYEPQHYDEDCDDSDADPHWSPALENLSKKRKFLSLIVPKRKKTRSDTDTEDDDVLEDERDIPVVSQSDTLVSNVLQGAYENKPTTTKRTTAFSKPKRKKGVRVREQEKKKKDEGLAYKNRKGKVHGPIVFKPIEKCCKRKKCFETVTPDIQHDIFKSVYSLPIKVRDQTLCERMKISDTKYSAKGRGKSALTHDRLVTVSYNIIVGNKNINVCKLMFMAAYGVTRGKLDVLVEKIRASSYGVVDVDMRGKHTPPNKTSDDEIRFIHQFIDKYPRHESHYARRDNSSEKIFLPSHLNIKIMYREYLQWRVENGHEKSVGYDTFRNIFKTKGYKFKEPFIDTCKTCDEFNVSKRHAASKREKDVIDANHNVHVLEAQKGYDCKREDKETAKHTDYQRVLVFDLQQILPVPYLTTNIAYYKRLLTMYNLTIRDCSQENESSDCCMWSELQGGRGADQIASCILKKLVQLPPNVEHVITYSDTCGGQNRNINMAVMFMYALAKMDNLKVIDQKFLLPGHTRLECDSDHARIERAKKRLGSSGSSTDNIDKFRIMVPRDWCQFVRALPGKKRFNVIEMDIKDFEAFSSLLIKNNVLVHRTQDTEKNPVEWLKIKWLRYTKTFGIIHFKYDLNPFSPFRTLNLIRDGKGRKICAKNLEVPNSYSASSIGVNPLKKKDLLSLLSLIDKEFHNFYKRLPTSSTSPEFDELDNVHEDSDFEDQENF